jgi:hypothetical protein
MATIEQILKGTVTEELAIKGVMKDIPSIDNTLTKEGYAADSKAVGDALNTKSDVGHKHTASEVGARPSDWMPTAQDVGARANTWMPTAEDVGARADTWLPSLTEIGAAPAGYGLGTLASDSVLADVDTCIYNGWYCISDGTANSPVGYGILFVLGRYSDDVEQYIFDRDYDYGSVLRRKKTRGVWDEWEWANPPMDFNVEYRTTKRYNGIPVYTKLIRFGNAPNNSTKNIQWAEAGEISLVMNCTCFSGDGVYLGDGELSGVWYTANQIHLYAMTKSDLSAETLFFILEYCKA